MVKVACIVIGVIFGIVVTVIMAVAWMSCRYSIPKDEREKEKE